MRTSTSSGVHAVRWAGPEILRYIAARVFGVAMTCSRCVWEAMACIHGVWSGTSTSSDHREMMSHNDLLYVSSGSWWL